MVELHIKIRKRIARLAYGENFVSYNEGYKIIFDFDREWDSIENKTARFIFGENYIDYPFNGNEVEIPLIKNADTLEIGVYSDNLYTTTAVKFKVLKSIKDEEKIEILVPEAYPEIEELDDEDLIRVYDKSEEKIGISPLKKLFDKMGVVIDEALAAAKESGEFDGKSAYSYAQDGGYTGTEEEFAAKLAAEGMDKALFVVNITSNGDGTYSANKTFAEIVQVYNEGKYNIVAIMALRTGGHIMPLLAAQKTGAVFGMVLGQTRFSFVITSNNEVQREMIQLATLKNKLPNPYPITFTGAVNETYDGSSAKTIEIPSVGAYTASYIVEEDVSSYTLDIDTSKYSEYVIFVRNSTNKAPSITINREHKRIGFAGYDANVNFFEINTLYSDGVFHGFSRLQKNNNTSMAYYNYGHSNHASGTTEENNGIIIAAETIGAGSEIFVRCM